MTGKIFNGVNADSFVTFNSVYNINNRQTQYEDEEAALLKDLVIHEVRYRNGKTLTCDEADKKLTAIIGISPDSPYINLTNEKGERLNLALAEGLVINKVVQGKYKLAIGDRLLFTDPYENINVEIEITGIVDQYSAYLAYIDRNLLSGILKYETGSYNSVFTNHLYQLSESRVNKILEIKDFEEGLQGNLRIFQVLSVFFIVLACVIAFVIILISANLVIEENTKGISTFKVLGYSDREISNLTVNTYTPLLVIGYFLSFPICINLMGILKTELETKFDFPMMLSFSVVNGVLGLTALLFIYFLGLRFSRSHITSVALAESLK
jgi:putative ABC transport system permease protein